MKTARNLLLVALCSIIGLAEANTLHDKPASIFYPEGHYLEGWPRKVGFDMFGYNYQAHKFQGYFANVYLGGDGFPPYGGDTEEYYRALVMYGFFGSVEDADAYFTQEWFWWLRDVHLRMIWNDAWLSNQDRGDDNLGSEPDGNLDRHYGYPSYFDSGAELVQYQVEPMQVERKGKIKTVNLYYYSKIVAVPGDAELIDGIWYAADGTELGPEVYGQFARVKTFLYDPLEGEKPRGRAWGRRIRDAGF